MQPGSGKLFRPPVRPCRTWARYGTARGDITTSARVLRADHSGRTI